MTVHLPQPEGKTCFALAIAGIAFGVWCFLSGLATRGPLGLGMAAFGTWFGGGALRHLGTVARRRLVWVSQHSDEPAHASSERPLLTARGQWTLFAVLVIGQSWIFGLFPSAVPQEPAGDAAATSAIAWLAAAILVFAARKLIRATAPKEALPSAATSLGLLNLAIPVSALTSAALFLAPHDGGTTASLGGYLIAAIVVVLVLDSVLNPLARLIQPPSRRSPPPRRPATAS